MPEKKDLSRVLPREYSIVEKVYKKSLITFILSSTSGSIGTLVDGAFIGNFLGVEAVAAYGMIWPFTLVLGLIGSILAGGSRSLYTGLAGHGKTDEANRTFTLAFLAAAVMAGGMIALVYSFRTPLAGVLGANGEHASLRPLIEQYLSALVLGLPFDSMSRVIAAYMVMDSDNSRVVLATVAGTVTDIVVDSLAIFVFHGGMFALALATAVSQVVYFSVLCTHFRRKKRMLRFSFRGIGKELYRIGRILYSGLPTGTARIAGAVGGILINHIIAGSSTSVFIAAYSVHKSVTSLFNATYIGVADTVWTLSSIYFGEEDRQSLVKLQRTAFRIGLYVTGFTAVLILFLARPLASIYLGRQSADALALGTEAARLVALSLPLYMLAYMFEDYLMGVQRFHAANFYNLVLELNVHVPAVWVMVALMGGRGAWFATPVTLLFMIVDSLFYIRHRGTGKGFLNKCLLLPRDFGAPADKELSITADTLLEVVGMSHLAGLFCRENGISPKNSNTLALCIEEIGKKIIEHGFGDGKPHAINIRILVKEDGLILRIRDDCKPFNLPEQYELTRSDEDDPAGNVGIRMVMDTCKDVQYLSTMSTNNLIIHI